MARHFLLILCLFAAAFILRQSLIVLPRVSSLCNLAIKIRRQEECPLAEYVAYIVVIVSLCCNWAVREFFSREELDVMDVRNQQLFQQQAAQQAHQQHAAQQQAAMERAYNWRIMGTPLPETSDSDVDVSVPNSQTPSALPSGIFARGYNLSSSFPQAPLSTIDAINTVLGPMFLCWPNPEGIGAVADAFYRRCTLPNVHGAIDGTHIRVKTPRQAENPVPYYNRKKFHSLALQGVCDADGVFLDISVGLPGSANDQRMLAFSGLYDQIHRSQLKMAWPVCRINGGYRLRPYLLGDSGYAIQQWLMIPYLQSSNLSEMESLYNEHHVRGRLVIEQAFGHLKGKFKLLEHGINSSVTWAAKIAYACCVLSNVLVKYRVGFWQKDVIPAYDRAGATSVANVHNEEFRVHEASTASSGSDLAKETRRQLGEFLTLH